MRGSYLFNRLGKVVLFFFAVAIGGSADGMEFYEATTGGNIDGSYWIVAEGEIDAGTSQKFRNFIKTVGHCDEVVLNSPGGMLSEGLQLGWAINQLCKETSVGKTEKLSTWSSKGSRTVYEAKKFDGVFDPQLGSCASSCVYAFMGGQSRSVSKKRSGLFVHQFYQQSGLATPTQKQFDYQDLSASQMTMGLLVSYLSALGSDPRLAAMAAAVPATTVYELTENDVQDLKIRRRYAALQQPVIDVTDSGFRVSSKSENGSTLSISCGAGRTGINIVYSKRLFSDPRYGFDADSERSFVRAAFKDASEFTFGGLSVPKSMVKVDLVATNLTVALALSLRNNFDQMKDLSFGVTSPMSAVRYFGFWLPYAKAPQLMKSLTKNCS